MPRYTILVVDDEQNLRKILAAQLKQGGYNAITADTGEKALEILKTNNEIKAVITDLKMPGISGVELMEKTLTFRPALPFILLTAYGSITGAVEAVKNGAFHYLEKPFDKKILLNTVKDALDSSEKGISSSTGSKESPDTGIIGRSDKIQKLISLILKVAKTDSTVLITGESGTGKELVARAIHNFSDRAKEPFITVNCAAIPENLMESEFFGHEKGAFTGAETRKPGRFELAGNGTLLLDEVAEIPVSMQAKLLRVLQENEFETVGGIKTIKTNARIIASTNKNLVEAVKKGDFREDLYYRLNVIPVFVPPLRERQEDIPLLINFFAEKLATEKKAESKIFSGEAIKILKSHKWNGNIRELKNVIERIILLSDSKIITPEELPSDIRTDIKANDVPVQNIPEIKDDEGLKEVVKKEAEKLEEKLIREALKQTSGNVTQAAKLLKLSRKGLQNKIKELGIKE